MLHGGKRGTATRKYQTHIKRMFLHKKNTGFAMAVKRNAWRAKGTNILKEEKISLLKENSIKYFPLTVLVLEFNISFL